MAGKARIEILAALLKFIAQAPAVKCEKVLGSDHKNGTKLSGISIWNLVKEISPQGCSQTQWRTQLKLLLKEAGILHRYTVHRLKRGNHKWYIVEWQGSAREWLNEVRPALTLLRDLRYNSAVKRARSSTSPTSRTYLGLSMSDMPSRSSSVSSDLVSTGCLVSGGAQPATLNSPTGLPPSSSSSSSCSLGSSSVFHFHGDLPQPAAEEEYALLHAIFPEIYS